MLYALTLAKPLVQTPIIFLPPTLIHIFFSTCETIWSSVSSFGLPSAGRTLTYWRQSSGGHHAGQGAGEHDGQGGAERAGPVQP